MSTELVPTPNLEASRQEQADDRPAIGSWWWVKGGLNRADCDRPADETWLVCVVDLGSNYAKVKGIKYSDRIALDNFHERCTAEPSPETFIQFKISGHREQVRELMGEIRGLCHRLGVPMRHALAAYQETGQSLAVVSGVSDVKEYETALVKAKDQTLPELFKKVRAEHELMATWMKAELIPAEAELEAAKETTETIAGKIHMVELYAGLQERLEQVRDGAPAEMTEKVHLMQRRCYMDEEALAKYEAGGMDFKDIGAFDRWISRDENFARIFPFLRCIVAFRVRRHDKDYGSLDPWIAMEFANNNKRTYLYIRNGQQLWRMETSIEFGSELFPKIEDNDLLNNKDTLWIKPSEYDIKRGHGIITGARHAYKHKLHKLKRKRTAQRLVLWKAKGKPKDVWEYPAMEIDVEISGSELGEPLRIHGKPGGFWDGNLGHDPSKDFRKLTPEDIYYDDVMNHIHGVAMEHNRIAVVLQGLLDRSTCLHPHPPWKLWTADGFSDGIELVYDVSRALTPGEAPDFEEYRKQLNRSMKTGCHTIGQYHAWHEYMEKLYGDKAWRHEGKHGRGPKHIHQVHRMKRDGSCEFKWTRTRAKAKWVRHPTRPGYLQPTYPEIETGWTCPGDRLTCVDAYTPGDFHMFYDDPRTREDYLKWAYILLSCEDWHHKRLTKPDEDAREAADTESDDE